MVKEFMYEQVEVTSIYTTPDNHIVLTIELDNVGTTHSFQIAT
jgi:hypothetical protein